MMCAYDRTYLEKAQRSLGRMLDYATHELHYDLSSFWEMFLSSPVSRQFERGEVSVLAGRSGTELALMVIGEEKAVEQPGFPTEINEEYWTGWALAYYQRETALPFSKITGIIPISEILGLYSPYHEMDIRQFCDRMNELYVRRKTQTNLKSRRLSAALSQSRLADLSGVPLRTIQQYEQGQKNINRARADTVIALSRVLCCDPFSLLENDASFDPLENA